MKSATLVLLFLSLAALDAPAIHAGEVDSATQRKALFEKDSSATLPIINGHTRKLLEEAIGSANKAGLGCGTIKGKDKDNKNGRKAVYKLQDFVYKKLGSASDAVPGAMDKYVRFSPELKDLRVCDDKKNSVYKEITALEAPALFAVPSLGCAVNIKGNMVGYDKFDHFFLQGWSYFREAYSHADAMDERGNLTNAGLTRATAFGDSSEKGKFGFTTTAVYSPGDLAANYEGMNFWACLTGDFCPKDEKPYVVCQDGKWKVNPARPFDWGNIVNAAFDELKNPNYYSSPKITENVERNIHEKGLNVPLSVEACEQVMKAYKHRKLVFQSVVSPQCIKLSAQNIFRGKKRVASRMRAAEAREYDLKASGEACQNAGQVCHLLWDGLKEVTVRNWWCRHRNHF